MNVPRSVRLQAPAKINLVLAVAPPNPAPPAGDGLHPIASWMACIDLSDELTVTRLEPDRASRYAILWHDEAPRRSPIDWSVTKDLAVRAHRLLEETIARPLPAQLKLVKRIPVGAGLAGGSSDAAACLLAVNELFDLGLPVTRLRQLASRLGSDVAFFLPAPGEPFPPPALVEGVGDHLERTPDLATDDSSPLLALILPDFDCATPAVYRAFDEMQPIEFRARRVRELAFTGIIDPASLFNDLAAPASRVQPRLGELLDAARRITDRPAHVTGSGSGLFLLLNERDENALVALRRDAALSGCAVIRARIL